MLDARVCVGRGICVRCCKKWGSDVRCTSGRRGECPNRCPGGADLCKGPYGVVSLEDLFLWSQAGSRAPGVRFHLLMSSVLRGGSELSSSAESQGLRLSVRRWWRESRS